MQDLPHGAQEALAAMPNRIELLNELEVDDLKRITGDITTPQNTIRSETFSNWDDMRSAHEGTVTRFLQENKPLGSPHPRDWFENGNSLTIETLDDGTLLWKYTKNDVTIPYVPQMVNGKMENVIKFPDEFKHSDRNIATFKITEGFTGNRQRDKVVALEYLARFGP